MVYKHENIENTPALNMVILKTLLMYLLAVTEVRGLHRPEFHVPYACSVLFNYGSGRDPVLIGAGSILDKSLVLVSVDNLNQLAPSTQQYFYRNLHNITVHAGSSYMDPRKAKNPPAHAQSKMGRDLFVPLRPSFTDQQPSADWNYNYWKNPTNLSRKFGKVEYDAYGVAFNVALLEVFEFTFSPFVMPIIVRAKANAEMDLWVKNQREFLEKQLMSTDRCFTYSYDAQLNQIRYHEVTYLPSKRCVDAFCMYQLSKCDSFPKRDHLFCYKSTKYVDVCPSARGAALYCDNFQKSVFGILTFAPQCGRKNTPGVYTSLPLVIQLYQKFKLITWFPSFPQYTLEEMALKQKQALAGT